jgi:peptidoglycan LD-endopeptidase LytH
MSVKIVPFNDEEDNLWPINLAVNSKAPYYVQEMDSKAERWFEEKLKEKNAKYAIGGYAEKRNSYNKSPLFKTETEPRCVHLGIDVFGAEGTAVFNTLDGSVHSFANNAVFGDYGPTIILKHLVNDSMFFSLYGHLSVKDFDFWKANFSIGQSIKAGTKLGHFGAFEENFGWTPHLHFQIIKNIGDYLGDYPGVCTWSEKEFYLENCPNPLLYMGFENANYVT